MKGISAMVNISFCLLGRVIPESFAGYILPYVRRNLSRAKSSETYTVIGAMWNGLACGAAVVEWDEDDGNIRSLFIDPKARRCGIAGRIVDYLLEEGARREKMNLNFEYILKDEELTAMDALIRARGGEWEDAAPVCGMKSEDFLDSPLLGPALRPGWKRPEHIFLFSEMTEAQKDSLNSGTGLPQFLLPSFLGERVDPALSATCIMDGKPVAFVLGFQSGDRMFCMSSVWRGPEAPMGSFRALVRTQVNQCWYRSGGNFSFFLSPINPRAAALAEWFTGGNYDPYTQREAFIPIPTRNNERNPQQ